MTALSILVWAVIFFKIIYIKIKDFRGRNKSKPEESETDDRPSQFEPLKEFGYYNLDFLNKIFNYEYIIDSDKMDMLNIFIMVGTKMAQTFYSLEKSIQKLSSDINDGELSMDNIESRIEYINVSLNSLLDASKYLSDSIFSIEKKGNAEYTPIPVKPELIEAYIQLISGMITFSFTYTQVHNITKRKLEVFAPSEIMDQYHLSINLFLKIVYEHIVNCILIIDSSVYIKKKGIEKDGND